MVLYMLIRQQVGASEYRCYAGGAFFCIAIRLLEYTGDCAVLLFLSSSTSRPSQVYFFSAVIRSQSTIVLCLLLSLPYALVYNETPR